MKSCTSESHRTKLCRVYVIGEAANSMVSADLTLMTAGSAANWPTISWQYGDVFPDPNDPAQYIDVDPTSYSVESNGILEFTGNSSSPARCPTRTTSDSASVALTTAAPPASLPSRSRRRKVFESIGPLDWAG